MGSGRGSAGLCVGVMLGVGGSVGLKSERECGTTCGNGDREYEGVGGYTWQW
jgi:hypothetical protein